MRLWPGPFLLALLLSQAASAQSVVVLEFDGDKGGKLRNQVEDALKKAKTVQVFSLKAWKDAAAKKKLKGNQAMTPTAVGKLAKGLGVDAAVEGAVSADFFVRILDPRGGELWSKDLPLKKGLVSADHAKKLARAITAAAEAAVGKGGEEAAEEPVKKKGGDEESGGDAPVAEEKRPEEEAQGGEAEEERRRPVVGQSEAERKRAEEEAEAEAARAAGVPQEKDRDLEEESGGKRPSWYQRVAPRLVSVTLSYRATWRTYCSRPGVDSCEAYDLLAKEVQAGRLPPTDLPTGDTVDFNSTAPYSGFAIGAEVFPIAAAISANPDNLALRALGFGLVGDFALGFSSVTVRIRLPTGDSEPQTIVSTDRSWTAQLAWRFFFSFGGASYKYRTMGHVGLRGGLGGRAFDIDPNANIPLPGPDRFFGVFGADLSLPIIKFFRLELGLSLKPNPTPGSTVILGYGDLAHETGGARSFGWELAFGASGEIVGPLGYRVQFRYQNFTDRFEGQGKKWTTPCAGGGKCGGADQETYADVNAGLMVSF